MVELEQQTGVQYLCVSFGVSLEFPFSALCSLFFPLTKLRKTIFHFLR